MDFYLTTSVSTFPCFKVNWLCGTACSKFLEKVCEKLLITCDKLDWTIRLVTRLFQQDRYSRDITISLQSCVGNFFTILLQHIYVGIVRTLLCKKSERLVARLGAAPSVL